MSFFYFFINIFSFYFTKTFLFYPILIVLFYFNYLIFSSYIYCSYVNSFYIFHVFSSSLISDCSSILYFPLFLLNRSFFTLFDIPFFGNFSIKIIHFYFPLFSNILVHSFTNFLAIFLLLSFFF